MTKAAWAAGLLWAAFAAAVPAACRAQEGRFLLGRHTYPAPHNRTEKATVLYKDDGKGILTQIAIWKGPRQIGKKSIPNHGLDVAKWSPNGRFFVTAVTRTDGHHPWETYYNVFDAQTRKFYLLNEFGLVGLDNTAQKMRFSGSDTLHIVINDYTAEQKPPLSAKEISVFYNNLGLQETPPVIKIKGYEDDWHLRMATVSLGQFLAGRIPQEIMRA